MAKRTYWKHGYKKKRLRRGQKEGFATVAEAESEVSGRKRKAAAARWNQEAALPPPRDPEVKVDLELPDGGDADASH